MFTLRSGEKAHPDDVIPSTRHNTGRIGVANLPVSSGNMANPDGARLKYPSSGGSMKLKAPAHAPAWSMIDFTNLTVQGLALLEDPTFAQSSQRMCEDAQRQGQSWRKLYREFLAAPVLTLDLQDQARAEITSPSSIMRAKVVVGPSMDGYGIHNGDLAIYLPVDGAELSRALKKFDHLDSLLSDNSIVASNGDEKVEVSKQGIFVTPHGLRGVRRIALRQGDMFIACLHQEDENALYESLREKGVEGPREDLEGVEKIRRLRDIRFVGGEMMLIPERHLTNGSPTEGRPHPLKNLRGIVVAVKHLEPSRPEKPLTRAAYTAEMRS